MNNLTNDNLYYIQQLIDYDFNEMRLLRQAFTRKSYSEEGNGAYNNEVLEFYGDKALEIIVMKKLDEYFGRVNTNNGKYISDKNEGQLTEIKKKLVCRKMLASRIDFFELNQFLLMGKGDIDNNVQDQESVKEDLFEAIIGAVTIDSDWNFEEIENVVDRLLSVDNYLKNGFENEDNNYVDIIQVWCQKKYNWIPTFLYEERSNGYLCQVILDDNFKRFTKYGDSKREARMFACKDAYEYLLDNKLLYNVFDDIGEPEIDRAINQLQELYQKGYINEPEYYFEETYDYNGNPLWHCECCVKGIYGYQGDYSSKKTGKKTVAYKLLNDLYENWDQYLKGEFPDELDEDNGYDDYDDDDEYYR